jgi:hypothetical protein
MVNAILAILAVALTSTLLLTLFVQFNDVQSRPSNVPPDDGRAHGCASASAAGGFDHDNRPEICG